MGIDINIQKVTMPGGDYYVFYDFGNINQPLLMLARHQMKQMLQQIPFNELKDMLKEINLRLTKVRE